MWGDWCADAIAAFDAGGKVNGTKVTGHAAPINIGDADPVSGHPIYYFAAPKPRLYVLYLPPANSLPISATSGRYEYFLFQYLRSKGIGVFVLRTPNPETDLWDHIPPHTADSPYRYNCSDILGGYSFCYSPCDMCTKSRSTDVVEAAIEKAAALGYTEQILMGWSSGASMASAFLSLAHQRGFVTAHNRTSYTIKGLVLLAGGSQFCYAYHSWHNLVCAATNCMGRSTSSIQRPLCRLSLVDSV